MAQHLSAAYIHIDVHFFLSRTHSGMVICFRKVFLCVQKERVLLFSSPPQRLSKLSMNDREKKECSSVCYYQSKKGERNDICSRSVFHFFWKWIFGSLSKPPTLRVFLFCCHSYRTLSITLGYIKDRFASSFFFCFGSQFFVGAAAAAALPFHLQLYNLFLSHHPSICIKNSNRCHANEIHERTTRKRKKKRQQPATMTTMNRNRFFSLEDMKAMKIQYLVLYYPKTEKTRWRKKKRHKINFHK